MPLIRSIHKKTLLTISVFLTLSMRYAIGNHVETVLRYLNIPEDKYNSFLLKQSTLPYNEDLQIMVIPEITAEENGHDLEYQFHILLMNKNRIVASYTEENRWPTDGGRTGITIRPDYYKLNKKQNAFAIELQYAAGSNIAIHSYQHILLFTLDSGTLKKVLDQKNAYIHGENTNNCTNKLEQETTDIIMSENQTNGYHDILLKIVTTNTIQETMNGDCVDKEKIVSTTIRTLTYNGEKYQ